MIGSVFACRCSHCTFAWFPRLYSASCAFVQQQNYHVIRSEQAMRMGMEPLFRKFKSFL